MENCKAPKVVLDLIEAAKEKSGVTSDNALAVRLGWHRQVISNYRQGTKPNTDNLLILCENAGIDFQKKQAEVEAAFAATEEARKRWENMFRQLGGMAASFMLGSYAIVTFIVTSPYSEAAPLLALGSGTFCIMLNRTIKLQLQSVLRRIRQKCTFSVNIPWIRQIPA